MVISNLKIGTSYFFTPLEEFAKENIRYPFLVIYGHLYTPNPGNYIRVFIYQFHMAFFFFVSGLLHKYNGNINCKKYIQRMLIPTVFFVSVYFIISGYLYYNDFWQYKEAVPNSIIGCNVIFTYVNYFKQSVWGMLKGSAMLNGPCWFLIALFYCKIFTDFIELRKIVAIGLYLIMFVLLCIFVHKYLFVANCIMAMPFYYTGFKCKNRIHSLMNFKHRYLFIPLCLLTVLLIMRYNGTVSMWSIKFGDFPILISVPLFYVVGFSGSILLLSLSTYLPVKWTRSLKFAADSLISILGLQVIFIFLVDNIWGYDLNYLISIVIALCVMILCLVVHFLISKFSPRVLGLE